jgi:hypothetical protein
LPQVELLFFLLFFLCLRYSGHRYEQLVAKTDFIREAVQPSSLGSILALGRYSTLAARYTNAAANERLTKSLCDLPSNEDKSEHFVLYPRRMKKNDKEDEGLFLGSSREEANLAVSLSPLAGRGSLQAEYQYTRLLLFRFVVGL